jgi:hypothetical protein
MELSITDQILFYLLDKYSIYRHQHAFIIKYQRKTSQFEASCKDSGYYKRIGLKNGKIFKDSVTGVVINPQ